MPSIDDQVVAHYSEGARPSTDVETRAERTQRLWHILLALVLIVSTITASTIIARWMH